MEVPLLERPDCQNESIHFSQFRCSSIQARYSDPIGTNYKQDNCRHFTIRGYVGDVRKKDAKICWPFVMVNHEACDEEFYKSMPPLHVVNFRRWNCTDCLPRTPSSVLNGAAAISGESTDPSFHQVGSVTSREHQVHSYDNADIAECDPSLCSPKPNSGCEVNGVTKASTICEGDDDLKEDNNKLEECIFVDNKLDGLRLAEEDEREDNILNVTVSLDHEDSPHRINCDDHKLIDSLQKASSDVSDKNPACENGSVNHTESTKTGPLNEIHDTSINENETPLQEIQNDDLVATYKDMLHNNDTQSSLSDDTFDGQDYHDRVQPSTKRSQHKVPPKMKLLADILRIAEHCKNQEIYSSNFNNQQPGTSKEGKPEASGEVSHFREQENSSLHKTDIALTQRGVGDECQENHDETTFLAHWLKKPKKSIDRKERSKNRGTSNTFCNINASTSAKDQKKVIINLNSVPCASRSEIESEPPSKKNAAIKEHDLVCKMIRKKRAARKGHNRPENTPSKQVDVKSSDINSAERVQHYETAVNDCFNSNVVLNNNKGKAPMVENEKPLEKHLVEDSSLITNTSDLEKIRERNKKLEIASICQEEVIDEFPMDIVELLARNQYERCLFNATMSTGAFNGAAEIKGNRKPGDPSLLSDFSESREATLLQCMNEHVSRKFPHTSSTKDRYPPWSTKQRCPTNSKVFKSVNVSERKLAGPPTGTSVVSGFRDYSQPRIVSLIGSASANMLERQVQGSYENLGQASGRNMPGIFSGLSHRRPSGGHIQKPSVSLNPICNSMNMVHHDPGLMKSLERPLNTITSNVSYREGKGKLSMQKLSSHVPVTVLESGKQQNAKMSDALDLYNNERTALQLLSMHDPATYSDKLCFQPLGIDSVPYSQESSCLKNLDPAFSTLELGQNGKDDKYPSMIGGRHHQISSSSKLFRPRPRFGVLGKYLQNEISTRSTKCETPFGSMVRCLSEIVCPAIGEEAPACPAIGEEAPARNSQLGSLGFRRERLSSKPSSNAEIIARDGHSLANSTNGTAIRPVGLCKREFCVINRNPAEFAIIDDDCEYMMKYDCPRHEATIPSSGLVSPICHHRGQKRQKVMKLADLQELLTS